MLASSRRQQQSDLANAIYDKLWTYWNRHLSNSSAISAILDLHYKLTTFNNQEERKNYINHLQTLFSSYISNSQITSSTTDVTSQDSRTYFLIADLYIMASFLPLAGSIRRHYTFLFIPLLFLLPEHLQR
ncbi:unnamed protein product [Rhizophagus irregularis]|nr:unnamed protein product [Rhizophagus irregularis]